MGSYLQFVDKIDKSKITNIFELGSRDLEDAIKLSQYYNSKVYAFECNPDCLIYCCENISKLDSATKEKITLVDNAVSLTDGEVIFFPFDSNKYDNMGASSMLQIDFSMRNKDDPDYNKENPQKQIKVNGVRLDTFINKNNIEKVDLICIDLQGYELNALKSLGDYLHNVKYIITECSIQNTYTNGATFKELNEYLNRFNFTYVSSNSFGNNFPDLTVTGFSEFDSLFINKSCL